MDRRMFLTYLEATILMLFVVSVFLSVSVISRLPFRYQQRTSAGQPYIEAQDVRVAGHITSIAADESYIYCCWGKRHIVKVYDFEGRHVSTIAISDQHNRGGTLMVSKEGPMVVLISDPHCYYFDKGHLASFDPRGSRRDQFLVMRNAADATGSTYAVQQGYVVRKSATGVTSTFVSSPPFLRCMTSFTIRIVDSLLLVCFLILHLAKGKLEGDR